MVEFDRARRPTVFLMLCATGALLLSASEIPADGLSLPKTPSVDPACSDPTLRLVYSLASTDKVPYSGDACAGDACAGDVANVCQRVESGCYEPGRALRQSDRVFARVMTESTPKGETRCANRKSLFCLSVALAS